MSQGTGLRRYYCMLLVIFLSLGALNIIFFARFEKSKCVNKTDPTKTTDIAGMTMPTGVIYFVLVFFCILRIYLIGRFSDYCPLDFKNLGRCDKCIGMFLKCIPGLLTLGHIALVVPAAVFCILRLVDSNCSNMATVTAVQSDFALQSQIVAYCTLSGWILVHFVTPFLRSFINYPSFLYHPTYNTSKFRRCFCRYTGP